MDETFSECSPGARSRRLLLVDMNGNLKQEAFTERHTASVRRIQSNTQY